MGELDYGLQYACGLMAVTACQLFPCFILFVQMSFGKQCTTEAEVYWILRVHILLPESSALSWCVLNIQYLIHQQGQGDHGKGP